MTKEEIELEIWRCMNDARYFHNKYMNYEGKKEYTPIEWNAEFAIIFHVEDGTHCRCEGDYITVHMVDGVDFCTRCNKPLDAASLIQPIRK